MTRRASEAWTAPAASPTTLSVSAVLPVMNETWSLEETVATLIADNGDRLCEILIVTASRTSAESLAVIEGLARRHPSLIRVHRQTLPHLGGALREAFALARGQATIMMASDLETDPRVVRRMIEEMDGGAWDIVAASRWLTGTGFSGYSPVKRVCNFVFQKLFAALYRVSLTDLTYGFRLYRTAVVQRIVWDELTHAFLFEALVKPLRLGCRVTEVPAVWAPRREGVSHNMLRAYADYFRIGLTVLLRRPRLLAALDGEGRP
jgi:dolichol-phosphate mannosyltransferase